MPERHSRNPGRRFALPALAILFLLSIVPVVRAASPGAGTTGSTDVSGTLGVREGDPDMPETGPRPGRTLTTSSATASATPSAVDGAPAGRAASHLPPWLRALLSALRRAVPQGH